MNLHFLVYIHPFTKVANAIQAYDYTIIEITQFAPFLLRLITMNFVLVRLHFCLFFCIRFTMPLPTWWLRTSLWFDLLKVTFRKSSEHENFIKSQKNVGECQMRGCSPSKDGFIASNPGERNNQLIAYDVSPSMITFLVLIGIETKRGRLRGGVHEEPIT